MVISNKRNNKKEPEKKEDLSDTKDVGVRPGSVSTTSPINDEYSRAQEGLDLDPRDRQGIDPDEAGRHASEHDGTDVMVVATDVQLVEDGHHAITTAEKVPDVSLYFRGKVFKPKWWHIAIAIILLSSVIIIPVYFASRRSSNQESANGNFHIVKIFIQNEVAFIFRPLIEKYFSDRKSSFQILIEESRAQEITPKFKKGDGFNYDVYIVDSSLLNYLNSFDTISEFGPETNDSLYNDTFAVLSNDYSYNRKGNRTSVPLGSGSYLYYYRKDIFERFNLKVPRTWDEYNEIAEFVHGMIDPVDNTTSLDGSCALVKSECSGNFVWRNNNLIYHAIFSSITMTKKQQVSPWFDLVMSEDGIPEKVVPILGDAFREVLRIVYKQLKYTPSKKARDCNNRGNRQNNDDDGVKGSCVQNVFSADLFQERLWPKSTFKGDRKLGVALLPGSTKYFDRSTGTLRECDAESCPQAIFDNDLGKWVNSPSVQIDGIFGALSNQMSDVKRVELQKLLAFISSNSEQYVIPEASQPTNHKGATGKQLNFHAFRTSHLQEHLWKAKGYDDDSLTQFLDALRDDLSRKHQSVTDQLLNYEFYEGNLVELLKIYLLDASTSDDTSIETIHNKLLSDVNSLMIQETQICDDLLKSFGKQGILDTFLDLQEYRNKQ